MDKILTLGLWSGWAMTMGKAAPQKKVVAFGGTDPSMMSVQARIFLFFSFPFRRRAGPINTH
jgi:hypothetical protein